MKWPYYPRPLEASTTHPPSATVSPISPAVLLLDLLAPRIRSSPRRLTKVSSPSSILNPNLLPDPKPCYSARPDLLPFDLTRFSLLARGAIGFRTGGDGGEAGAAACAGGACGGARLEARLRLLQGGHGEEQAVRRAAPHRREVPGALQAALLHPPRKVN